MSNPSNSKSITVENNTNSDIKVSINQWGTTGDTSYTTIHPYGTESWRRGDERGYVMACKLPGANNKHTNLYYVGPDSAVVVNGLDDVTGVICALPNKSKLGSGLETDAEEVATETAAAD